MSRSLLVRCEKMSQPGDTTWDKKSIRNISNGIKGMGSPFSPKNTKSYGYMCD